MKEILRKITDRICQIIGYRIVKLPFGLSLKDTYLSLSFKSFIKSIHDVEGSFVECGVGSGISFLILTQLARSENKGRRIWGFDSFEGFPEPSVHDKSPRNPKKGEWGDTSINKILKRLHIDGKIEASFIKKHVKLIKGFFNESLIKYDGEPIALLHLDCDLFESYKVCLEFFWPKVANGGVVIFDEYKSPSAFKAYPGASKAIDEFFGVNRERIKLNEYANKYYLFKL